MHLSNLEVAVFLEFVGGEVLGVQQGVAEFALAQVLSLVDLDSFAVLRVAAEDHLLEWLHNALRIVLFNE